MSVKESKSPSRYSNILKALRLFSRFIKKPELASNYAFPLSIKRLIPT
jgi:hypothetical protein